MTRTALAALAVGDANAWRVCASWPAEALVRELEAHGLLPLVAEAARTAPAGCPDALRAVLEAAAARHLAVDLLREHELRRAVVALIGAGVPVILMKGADLAYGAYARPDLRPRTDSDLLVEAGSRSRAAEVLRSLGYDAVPQSGGGLLMYQEPFRLLRDGQVAHVVDLHWRVFNPQRYGGVLTFPDMDDAAEPRPALTPGARGLGAAHALLLACVHRVAHHFNHDRLIWLYDIRVLAAVLQPHDWERVLVLASTYGTHDACGRTLVDAQRLFGAAVPTPVIETLRAGADEAGRDAAFLNPRAAHARRVLSDFRHVGGWRRRVALARQHLFPPADYMRTVYAPSSTLPLWALYLRRIARGSRRWLVGS